MLTRDLLVLQLRFTSPHMLLNLKQNTPFEDIKAKTVCTICFWDIILTLKWKSLKNEQFCHFLSKKPFVLQKYSVASQMVPANILKKTQNTDSANILKKDSEYRLSQWQKILKFLGKKGTPPLFSGTCLFHRVGFCSGFSMKLYWWKLGFKMKRNPSEQPVFPRTHN